MKRTIVAGAARCALLVVGLAVLGGLAARFGLTSLGLAVRHADGADLFLYALLAFAVACGYVARWRLVAHAVGGRLPFRRLLAARLAGDAVGSLVPAGRISGDPVRVAWLYAEGTPGVRAGAGVAIDRVMELTGNSIAAVVTVAVYWSTHAPALRQPLSRTVILLPFAALLALIVTVGMLWRGVRPLTPVLGTPIERWWPRWQPVAAQLRQTEDQLMRFFREHRRVFIGGLCGSLAIETLIAVEYHYLLAAFGLRLDLSALLLVMLGSGIARVIPMPAALGTLEASQIAMITLSGGRPDVGFLVGLVLRMHETLWLIVGLLILAGRSGSLRLSRVSAAPRQTLA